MARRALRSLLSLGSIVTLGVLATGFTAACSSKTDEPAPTGSEKVVLAQGVTLLEAKNVTDVTVMPGKLVFPKATHADILTKKAGDVLVGDMTDTTGNPYGFLRKVVSIAEEGSNIVVTTEGATLGDVVQEGELAGSLTIPSLADAPAAGSLSTKGGDPIKLLDFSGKQLVKEAGSVEVQPGKTLGYDVAVTLTKGTLDFTPTFDVGAKVKPAFSLKGAIKEAHVIATGQLDAVAEIDAQLKLTGTATGEDVALLIAKKVFKASSTTVADKTFKLPGLKVGFINVPAHAKFKAVVKCDLKWGGETRVVFGGKASAKITAGARYDGSKISPVFEHSESLEQIGPTWTIAHDLGLRCAIVPEFSLNLWDVASGEVVAEAYGAIAATAKCNASKLTGDVTGEAYAGVTATAHAKLDVFGLFEWEKECTLFDMHSPHVSASGSFPLGSGATCTPQPAAPAPTPVSSPPASCFGSKTVSGGGDGGTVTLPGTDGGTSSGSDTGSGSGSDAASDAADADETPPGVACSHDVCTDGAFLTTGCTKDSQGGACIAAICANDKYCCENYWSASCIKHVQDGDFGCAVGCK